ncbi:TPA: hypothetical protein KD856_003999 [Vibrio parahaemolyticus]|nr:hypothetical protein [Vibrio parahaemolyticus]
MMMRVPQHVVTTIESSSRLQLARQFPGKYHLTIENNGWRTRYYSDEPTVAVSEAWRRKVEQETAPDHWCLLDLHEKDVLFFMAVRGRTVREARLVPLEELDEVKLKLCEQVFVTERLTQSESRPDLSAVSDKIDTAPTLDPKDTQPYQLKSNRIKHLAIGGALLACLIGGLSVISHHQAKPKEVVQHVIDDYHAYRSTVGRSLSATNGMARALSLTTLSVRAPSGWQLSNITLKGTQLMAVIQRDDVGLLSTAKTWLGTLSKPTSILTVNTLTFTEAITEKLDKWTTQSASAELGQTLLDTLVQLGWHLTDSKESKTILTSTLDMTLRKNSATVSELNTLVTLFRPLPVGLNAFTLTPNADGTFRIELRIQYFGEIQ